MKSYPSFHIRYIMTDKSGYSILRLSHNHVTLLMHSDNDDRQIRCRENIL